MSNLAKLPDPSTTTTDNSYKTALEPHSFRDAMEMAGVATKANIGGCKTPEEAFIKIATGRELNLSAMASLRSIHVINGRAALDASLIIALCLNAPVCDYFEPVESTAKLATYRAKRRGRPEQTLTWTIEQAELAGIMGNTTWKKYPDAMLRARCIAALARMVFPDVISGLYTPDEIGSPTAPDDVPAPRATETVVQAVPVPVESGPRVTELTMTELKARIEAIDSAESAKAVGAELAAAVKSGELAESNRALAKELLAAKYAEYVTKAAP